MVHVSCNAHSAQHHASTATPTRRKFITKLHSHHRSLGDFLRSTPRALIHNTFHSLTDSIVRSIATLSSVRSFSAQSNLHARANTRAISPVHSNNNSLIACASTHAQRHTLKLTHQNTRAYLQRVVHPFHHSIRSIIQSCIHSFVNCCISKRSLAHSHSTVHLLLRLITHSFIHTFMDSLIHSLCKPALAGTQLLTHSLAYSLTHLFKQTAFIHWFIPSFIR